MRDDGKRDRVSMKASSAVIGLLSEAWGVVMDGGRGGRSKRGLLEIRRVVRPGKTMGRSFRRGQVAMLFREISRERSVWGNWKVVVGSVITELT